MAKRIRARVTRTRKVYVHNDISQAATTFNETTQEKAKGDRTGIGYYGMATAVLTAFAFEAKLNFMGAQLAKNNKISAWNEFQSWDKKVKIVFGALGLSTDKTTRPLATMEKMKRLRDTVAHGKPIELTTIEIVTGISEDVDLAAAANLSAGWETECTPDSVAEGVADLDALWKQMVEKSGLNLFDTITQGSGSVEFIEQLD
jgi:hypothetical protein